MLQQYYAGPGNKFWYILSKTSLTQERLNPPDYHRLLDYGIGLTDLVKAKAGMDAILTEGDFDQETTRGKIERFQPGVLCFNGKKAGSEFLERKVEYGRQREVIC